MKKLLIILFLSFSILTFSQKRVEIYNYSTKTISISTIISKPTTGIYPWFASITPSVINIAPGG